MVSSAQEECSAVHVPRGIRLALYAAVVAATASGCSRSARTYLERGNAQFEKGNIDAAVLE
jgi:hypothetical protein